MSAVSYLQENVEGYDIIGDIHGCAKSLERLLIRLGYSNQDGVYQQANRKAIFVGDIIDRGPRIRKALQLVRAMVDNDQAHCILGNHEFNAVAYTTEVDHKDADPRFLRAHDKRNNRLIQETLVQFASYPEEWRSYLQWFQELPVYIDTGSFRVVHACWDNESINEVSKHSNEVVTRLRHLMPRLMGGDKSLTQSLDTLTRGTSLHYPDGRYILSRDGIKRYIFRTKFWAKDPSTYQDVIFQPDPLPEDLNDRSLEGHEHEKLISYPESEKPVFFGHYWLHGRPRLQGRNLACLDYSAVKFGRLVAYRYDGETSLSREKFEWVYIDPDAAEEVL